MRTKSGKPAVKKPVLAKAADLLARQEHSSVRLKEKLLRYGYSGEEIDEAIGKLQAAHYLDDEGACRRGFEYFYRETKFSVRQICQKLAARGFEFEMIRGCIPDNTSERETAAALKWLRSKFLRRTPVEKMQQYLYVHGFGGSIRRDALEQYLAEKQTEWEKENGNEE